MNRLLPAVALAVAILALVMASMSFRRDRPQERVAEERAAAAPVGAAAGPAAVPAAGSGMSAEEAARIAREAVKTRETEIVDRLWPRVRRMRERWSRPEVVKPTTLDALLGLLLEEGGDAREEDTSQSPDDRKKTTECRNDLKQIGVYFALYEAKNRFYPATIEDLKAPDLISDPAAKVLKCPYDTSGDATSFEYLHPVRGDNEPPDMIMAYDRHLHPDGRRCVLYFQGRVEAVNESDFQKQLGEQIARDRASLPEEIVKLRAAVLDPALAEKDKAALSKRLSILERLSR